jgi:hypothetical protein
LALLTLGGSSGSLLGCSHAPALATAPAPAPSVSDQAPAATARPPSELQAYCDQLARRRAAFHPQLIFEVRSVSLEPRAGYARRALTPEEQALNGAARAEIFMAPESVITTADVGAATIVPSGRNPDAYDLTLDLKSPKAVSSRLAPLFHTTLGIFVDGQLVSLPRLISPTIRSSIQVGLTLSLPETRTLAAKVNPAEDTLGVDRLEERCRSGDAPLCSALAEERLVGRDLPHDPKRAVTLFERGCRQQLGVACRRAAELDPDSPRAAELEQAGCQLNDGPSCLVAARRLLHRPAAPDAIAQGRTLLTRACDRGFGRACMALAEDRGRDLPDTPPLAEQQALLGLIERACAGGDADACFTVAQAARRGLVGPPDPQAAKRWFRAGCALDPTGGTIDVEVRFAHADPALLQEIQDAGCGGDPPAPAPRPALCARAPGVDTP